MLAEKSIAGENIFSRECSRRAQFWEIISTGSTIVLPAAVAEILCYPGMYLAGGALYSHLRKQRINDWDI